MGFAWGPHFQLRTLSSCSMHPATLWTRNSSRSCARSLLLAWHLIAAWTSKCSAVTPVTRMHCLPFWGAVVTLQLYLVLHGERPAYLYPMNAPAWTRYSVDEEYTRDVKNLNNFDLGDTSPASAVAINLLDQRKRYRKYWGDPVALFQFFWLFSCM